MTTFRQMVEEVWAMKEEPRTRPSSEAHKIEGITWKEGDRFNYRIFAALLLVNPASAKLYFRTTSYTTT